MRMASEKDEALRETSSSGNKHKQQQRQELGTSPYALAWFGPCALAWSVVLPCTHACTPRLGSVPVANQVYLETRRVSTCCGLHCTNAAGDPVRHMRFAQQRLREGRAYPPDISGMPSPSLALHSRNESAPCVFQRRRMPTPLLNNANLPVFLSLNPVLFCHASRDQPLLLLSPDGQDHELLHGQRVAGVAAAVDDVERGHRQDLRRAQV